MPLGTAVAVPEMVVGRQTIVVVPDMVLEVVSHSQVQEIGMVGPQTRALVMAAAAIATGTTVIQGSMGNGLPVIGPNDGDGPYSRSRPTGRDKRSGAQKRQARQSRADVATVIEAVVNALQGQNQNQQQQNQTQEEEGWWEWHNESRRRRRGAAADGDGGNGAAAADGGSGTAAVAADGGSGAAAVAADGGPAWQQMVLDLELLCQQMVVQWQMVALVLLDQHLHLQAMWQQMSPVRLVVSLFGIWIARSVWCQLDPIAWRFFRVSTDRSTRSAPGGACYRQAQDAQFAATWL